MTGTIEERPVTATEPPVLDPIPKVEPISAEQRGDASLSEGISPVEPIAISTEEPRGTVTPPVRDLDHAELVASHVFSAPIVNDEPPQVPDISPLGTLEQAAAVPLPTAEHPNSTASKAEIEPSTMTKPTTLAKPTMYTKPVTSGIAPAPTTQTTITGPASTLKEPKGESKVSSWLKSKLSASRNSKPAKPVDTQETSLKGNSKDKSFVGGVNLTNPSAASNSSLDPATSSSVREVAMAGRQPAAVLHRPADDDDELYAASEPQSHSRHRDRSSSSPSISSVSSDEDTRGRPMIRREETESSRAEEFEEALDHFDEEALAPPAALAEVGRVGGSPVRDSKFQEIL